MKMFTHKRTKKGSLQLSINAIVILILAITMLGLGLSFIKGIFGGTVEKLKGIQTQLAEEERKQLQESAEEITFLTTRIAVSGREKAINFALRNVLGDDTKFGISTACSDSLEGTPEDMTKIVFKTYEFRTLDATKSDVLPMVIEIGAGTTPTIYSCEMTITNEDEQGTIYATKRFEIDYKK